MHTGYDNYWIYQNSRPEPLLSLPVSDISHAEITDNYIQCQNGEISSHFRAPRNNINSFQNEYRMTGSKSMWPHLAYQYPSRTSYANNFHLQNFSNHVNHPKHSSQKNHVTKNFDVNFGRTYSRSNHYGYLNNQSNKTTSGHTSRIQVKSVFSLRNYNCNNVQNSMKESSLFHQKEAHQLEVNHKVNRNRSLDCDFQPEYVDYGKLNLLVSNQHFPTFESRTAEQNCLKNQKKYIPSLEEVCQKNFQFLSRNQLNFSNNSEIQRSSLVHNTGNDFQMFKKLLSAKNVEEAITLKNCDKPCNPLQRNNRIKINPNKNTSKLNDLEKSRLYTEADISNKTFHLSFSEQNERLTQNKSDVNGAIDIQNHPPESNYSINQSGELLSQSGACSELRKFRKSEENAWTNNTFTSDQESSMIKITIPHTGQSTFINFNDTDKRSKNQNLSLSCLLNLVDGIGPTNQNNPTNDSNNAQVNKEITVSMLLPDQRNLVNHNTSHNANPACNTSSRTQSISITEKIDTSAVSNSSLKNQGMFPEESVAGGNSVKNSSNFLLEPNNLSDNSPKNNPMPNNISTETFPFNKTDINDLEIKQEQICARAEAPEIQFNEDTVQDEAFYQNIKSEKNCDESIEILEQKMELQLSENSNPSVESLHIDADNTENIDFSQTNLKERVFYVKKTMSTVLKDTENRIQKLNMPNETSTEEKKSLQLENKTLNKNLNKEKSYRSQINRDKLDLLIQFLKKDEETVKVKNRVGKKTSGNKIDVNHNRRKPNKTCIVKNKNNSREMVSLVSHKTPRVETNKSSLNISGISQADKNCNQTQESEAAFEYKADYNVDKVKCNQPSEMDRAQQNIVSSPEPQNKVKSESDQETVEKNLTEKYVSEEQNNVTDILQALQKLQTHFCIRCDLVLSVDSFWINVVSGELRCFNCFKTELKNNKKKIYHTKNNTLISSSEEKSSEQSISCENNSENEGRLECVSATDFGEYNADYANEVETEAQNVRMAKKILSKNYDRQVCTANSEEVSSQKKTTLKDQKIFKVNEMLKSNKSKKNVALKTKGSEDSLKLKTIEDCDNFKSKKAPAVDDFDCTSKPQNSKDNSLPFKSIKNSASENCSAIKSLIPRYSESFFESSVVKNVAVERSDSPKTKSSKNIVISEDLNSKTTNKSGKSQRKINFVEMKKQTQEKVSQNQGFERNNSKDFICRKDREENRNKEITEVVSSSFKKINLVENCDCDKTRTSEEVSKKSTKYENLDKRKKQNGFDQKQKILKKKKKLEDHLLRNNSSFCKSPGINKSKRSLEQSRKRKNSDEYHGAQKVRIVEEHAKKAIKQMTSTFDKCKTNFSEVDKERNKTDNKKFNSVEKPKNHRLFKETYVNAGEKSSEEAKLKFRFSAELKTYKNCIKQKSSQPSKDKTNISTDLSRKSSLEEYTPSKNGFLRETSKNEVGNSTETYTQLKKNYSLKEEHELFKALERSKKEIKYFCDSFENQESNETDNIKDKKINGIVGKIPKIAHPSSDADYREVMRSSFDDDQTLKSDEVSKNLIETDIVKVLRDKPSNTSSGVRTHSKKKAIEGSNKNAPKEKNINHSEIVKINVRNDPKISEGSFDTSKLNHGLDSRNEKREEYYFPDSQKKTTILKKCQQTTSENGKTQSADLMEVLLKKTKKLSWSLLGEAKNI